MANVFNAAEIIDMGIEKEKKRRDFYALAAENFSDEEIKELFTKLRDWEETHIEKFSEIRDTVKDLETTGSYPGELEDYMNVLIDEKLYSVTTPEVFAMEVPTPRIAITRGMDFEKDAILFFTELLPHMPEHNKPAIQQLIDEEKQHLIFLARLKTKYE